ncbi:nuclease-related domain-containing protein [Evansella sp. AB-rgal1]|uniref:nuclease-related domain-containing protein n=1 Tax=Evansella sp. AB-rgal1 TaxID=3242696 RepID=UPI00359EB38A
MKPLKKSIYLRKLEALSKRILQYNSSFPAVEKELISYKSGFRGEKSLEYYFTFLDEKNSLILHDLRLPYKTNFFQMDVIILTLSFIYLLEVKNLIGNLEFDPDFHQLIRTYNEKVDIFSDPIQQGQRHIFQLKAWLTKMKFPSIPIESNVVITNPQARIITPTPRHSAYIIDHVIRSSKIEDKVRLLGQKYPHQVLQHQDMRKLSNRLIKSHTPQTKDILEHFRIPRESILKGVHCPNCSSLPMTRLWGAWHCSFCKHSSEDAHIAALNDYALLIDTHITNAQLRDFLQVPSIRCATYLLQSMNFPYTGTFRDRTYTLPLEE